MTEYRLSELGISEEDLFNGLHSLRSNYYSYKYNENNMNIIYLSNTDQQFATMPPVEDILLANENYKANIKQEKNRFETILESIQVIKEDINNLKVLKEDIDNLKISSNK